MAYTLEQLEEALGSVYSVRLAHLPTPLEPAPRLSAALGDVEIWIKRDDCTGLAFGGNKTRQLEYTMGQAVAGYYKGVLQGAASQSNHCRQIAAAAAQLGLRCHLLLQRDSHAPTPGHPAQGNLLLDSLFGAEIHWTDAPLGKAFDEAKKALAEKLRAEGESVYLIGGVTGKAYGAVGYVKAMCEMVRQWGDSAPDYLYTCASTATHLGLVTAREALGLRTRVEAIAPIVWDYDARLDLQRHVPTVAALLGIDLIGKPNAEDIHLDEGYVGPAYAVMTPEAREAIELTARTEGILLDPAYSGKAMAALIDHVRRGVVPPGSKVVFLHTGGTPALFCYADELTA